MASVNLETYLNDHLAGAVAVLEMLQKLAVSHGELTDVDVDAIHRLERSILADRATLESLMESLDIKRSAPRRFVGWLGEKAARLKLFADDTEDGAFRVFETIEAVAIGIDGKSNLWKSLRAVSSNEQGLTSLDFDDLLARADDQRALVEALHLRAATDALV